MIDDIIAGFALDADDWRPRSEADLLRYYIMSRARSGLQWRW